MPLPYLPHAKLIHVRFAHYNEAVSTEFGHECRIKGGGVVLQHSTGTGRWQVGRAKVVLDRNGNAVVATQRLALGFKNRGGVCVVLIKGC